jgi:phosphoserine phosphatase
MNGKHPCMRVTKKVFFSHIDRIMQGEDKASYLVALGERLNLPASSFSAYSDSHLDIAALKVAGKAIGVQPNAALRKICLKNRWEIL